MTEQHLSQEEFELAAREVGERLPEGVDTVRHIGNVTFASSQETTSNSCNAPLYFLQLAEVLNEISMQLEQRI
jgi:hypothetical protein